MTKIFMIDFMLGFLCLMYLSSAFSDTRKMHLNFVGHTLSANLDEVSLGVLLENLKREKGIWFRGDESLLEEKVSVRFRDLSLQNGLRRILSGINHVLVFDRDEGLVGVFILSKKHSHRSPSRNEAVVAEKAFIFQPEEKITTDKNPFETSPKAAGNPWTKSRNTRMGKNLSSQEFQRGR
jgi:hypothetical protein